ncbi:aldehyde dehydrogenase family protein [Nocardioides nitrophenolicus]|uniref:aldehyde dehydrogenase family protein n=1 Tax=Nocardioides nitrophenolicus TaxID=60489 RepID=UPI00195A04D0|nr:aldehyde dehydrogenase family protein [Nocardioides nitrophenolicus]MBM7516498.1 aldehyde dehydrogenase (NAD+)/betaine-aldehyde dehydrogenase [Nocardioides nitrophenolicus]
MSDARLTGLDLSATTYVDGRWRPGEGEGFGSVDPATGRELARWTGSSTTQAEAAIAAARASLDDGRWARRAPAERAAVLRRIADLLEADHERLARLVTAEVGSPITLARSLQTATPVANFRWAADMAEAGPRGGYREHLPAAGPPAASESVLLREPIGVVAAITPYNYPINMVAWKVGPALAAGCSVVLLPSPRGTLCTLAFARLAAEAGLPPGVLNVVVGGADLGRLLSTHPSVDMVTFTGSNAVGETVMKAAAPTSKKVVLELGGKSPTVILPGADLARAVGPSLLRFCRNAGQGCGATTRIVVPRDRMEEFVAAATAFLDEHVPVGDPTDERTEVGPLISAEHRARVEGYLERAVADGATLAYGGDRPDLAGWYLRPTLVTGVEPGHEICQDELFAPVAVLLPYDDVDQAVAIANDSRYGLNALVWGPHEEAVEVALRLETGTVAINGGGGARPDVPWVGAKQSGVGMEMGSDGFAEFFTVKHLQWPAEPVA